ncbi:hypothetical protein SDC9_83181 [bioreactor metagenome]|uniref:Uncharacterized protein n=1 Tax=bioreactor metagenome TaxID=1076179 RepID=A0A644Z6Z8_9ZZZZ
MFLADEPARPVRKRVPLPRAESFDVRAKFPAAHADEPNEFDRGIALAQGDHLLVAQPAAAQIRIGELRQELKRVGKRRRVGDGKTSHVDFSCVGGYAKLVRQPHIPDKYKIGMPLHQADLFRKGKDHLVRQANLPQRREPGNRALQRIGGDRSALELKRFYVRRIGVIPDFNIPAHR